MSLNPSILPARSFSVSIRCEWRELYEQIWHPSFFSRWAAGLAESELRENVGHWEADSDDGLVVIRFTPHNALGGDGS